MKYTKQHQKVWDTFTKKVVREKKRLRIRDPKWTFGLDKKIKGWQVILNYTIPYQTSRGEGLVIRYKNKKKYIKNRKFEDLELVQTELKKYHELIMEEHDQILSYINVDDSSVSYWIDIYTKRGELGTESIKPNSILRDADCLRDFMDYIQKVKPKYNNIFKIDRGFVKEYLDYRMKHGSRMGNKVGAGFIRNNYNRIRAFYNWVSVRCDGLTTGLLNSMGKQLPKIESKTESFSTRDIIKVTNFIEECEDDWKWSWFIPILRTLLVTGCRISEAVLMKVDDIDVGDRKWFFSGKGDKKRVQYITNDKLWEEIKKRVIDPEGNYYEKEYVFHREYYRMGNQYEKIGAGKGWIIDYQKPFNISGVRNKFYKMVKHLNLDPSISPHSCRRFFITEMLKETNGNIPLVAQLVGHSTWDVVKLYARNVVPEGTKTNLVLKDIISKTQ